MVNCLDLRKKSNPDICPAFHIESAALDDVNVFCFQKRENEVLILINFVNIAV